MPTTIRNATNAFVSALRSALVGTPLTPAAPLRRVEIGQAGTQEYPRPFLTLLLTRSRPVGTADGNKLMRVSMGLRVVTDVVSSGLHDSLLDAVAAVDDAIDGIVAAGVLEGADGFDDREWVFEYPRTTSGARVASAVATQDFVVHVQRTHNREPS